MHLRHAASMVKTTGRSPLGEAHGRLILISVAGILVGSQAYAEEVGDGGASVLRKCMAYDQVDPSARNGAGPVLDGTVGRVLGTPSRV